MQKQQGFLSMIVVLLILLTGVFAVAALHAFSATVSATTVNNFGHQAFFAAEAGMQRAGYYLLTENISEQLSCNTLENNINLTAVSLSGGDVNAQFTVTNEHPTNGIYQANSAILATEIYDTDIALNVNSTAGYASSGFVTIDFEVIQYSSITATSFNDLVRGRMGTEAVPHRGAAIVSQHQCSLLSTGVAKDFVSPLAKRSIAFNLVLNVPAPEGWAVGKNIGDDARVVSFNKPIEGIWNYQLAADINKELKGVSIINKDLAWAVGKKLSEPTRFNIIRWDGSSWTEIIAQPPVEDNGYILDLEAVSVVSDHDVWAVGKGIEEWRWPLQPRYNILHYDGTEWCLLGVGGNGCSSISVANSIDTTTHLKAVHVIDSDGDGEGDFGFAAGKDGKFLKFNGSGWTEIAMGGSEVKGVFVLSATDAWAVGKSNTVFHWSGSFWQKLDGNTGLAGIAGDPEWRGVYMLDTDGDGEADDGWMVGKGNRAARYSPDSGGQWTDHNTTGVGNMNAVAMFSSTDVWAVADDGNLAHWDGSAWTVIEPPDDEDQNLKDISLFVGVRMAIGGWQELFS